MKMRDLPVSDWTRSINLEKYISQEEPAGEREREKTSRFRFCPIFPAVSPLTWSHVAQLLRLPEYSEHDDGKVR